MIDDRPINDRYRVVRLVGQGGMGAVYEAIDTRLGCPVALKRLKSIAGYPTEAFEREARLLAQLRHPVFPVVTDYFVIDDDRFVVMQFIAGRDLSAELKSRVGGFPEAQVLSWLDQVLDGLTYLHGFQPPIVHRDIKPANLKLTPQGEVVLLDFGLAKGGTLAGDAGSQPSVVGYTPRYAPLEQIEGRGTDVRSDLYALGATACHLLTGVAPANALERARAVVDGLPDPLAEDRFGLNGVEPALRAILLRAVALKSADRFPSAAEMRNGLHELAARRRAAEEEFGQPTLVVATPPVAPAPATLPSPEPVAARGDRARSALVLGLTAILVLAATLGVAYWQGRQRARGADDHAAVSGKQPPPSARAPFDIPAPPDAEPTRPASTPARSADGPNVRPPASPARKVLPSAEPAADLGPVVRVGEAIPSSNFGDVAVTVVSITRPESSVLRLNLLFQNASNERVSIALDYSSSGLSDSRGERYPVVNHAINRTPGWTFDARLEPGGQARHWIDVVAPAPGITPAKLELATASGSSGAARFEPVLLRLPSSPQ